MGPALAIELQACEDNWGCTISNIPRDIEWEIERVVQKDYIDCVKVGSPMLALSFISENSDSANAMVIRAENRPTSAKRRPLKADLNQTETVYGSTPERWQLG